MEFANFLKVLWKHKNLLIIVPLVAIIISYFLVKNLADKYVSTSQIATGIIDESRHLLDKETNSAAQAQQINQSFSNLIEIMKLKKLVNQVSYQLILHDLTSPTPFKPYSKLFLSMNAGAKKHAIELFSGKFKRMEAMDFYNKDENGLNDLLRTMKYDERSLREDIQINRDEDSDFITVGYESPNPQLSAFVVNVLCREFISYYTHTIKQNETDAVTFLAKLLIEKRDALNKKTAQLQDYKIRNGVLNLEEQSKAIYDQIVAYGDRKQQAQKDVASYNGALANIDNKFDPKDRGYIEATLNKYNTAAVGTQDQLHQLTDLYVRSNFAPQYKVQIDSLTRQLTQQLNLTSDKYLTNPLTGKDALVAQKLSLEVTRDLAKYSILAIDKSLNDLNARFNRLVPFDATVKTYNFELDIASKEYLEVLTKYNETNLKSTFSIKLRQVDYATPDAAEPSKKMLLIIISGVGMFVVCVVFLFVLYFLDETIKQPAELVIRTHLPSLGYLNTVTGGTLDLRKLWDVEHREKMKLFKELIRSLRFEIDQELKGEKVLAITSLDNHEGKTVLAIALSYSYAMINKKVLLIDGNFTNPTITATAQPRLYIEDYFKNNPDNYEGFSGATTVLGNHGGDVTLLEVSDENFIRSRFNELKTKYDIIIIETPALTNMNKSKEWMLFANKVIGVFEANKGIKKTQKANLEFLRAMNGKFAGWVLNKASIPED
ncbi:exopolysaccharide transport family protein [Mucilaginibacter psychrotolerans]|uniref:Lipopolysaccharide biosynthesis protein n=1 Tax=Mucilaginibacter psychrotolerans TaxID=1524096 RepID=A0A4Y8SL35_9SPHI|nr:Wzz/FepE/Etk N-terminal domain-containing protein [Mucilaginibacter psychrotolerans]TFF39247.1 lipopolysaccharide biosynthesis protein [Mucilaginibacter psychrotolerans]